MLGLRMSLTPAQVDMLLILAYCKPGEGKWADGEITKGAPLEAHAKPNYLVTMGALESRGLVHNPGRGHLITEEGKAVASLIVAKARAITELADSVSEQELAEWAAIPVSRKV